jgi:hypothetical protein
MSNSSSVRPHCRRVAILGADRAWSTSTPGGVAILSRGVDPEHRS